MNWFLCTIFFAGASLGFAKSYIPVMAKLASSQPYFVGISIGMMTLSWPVFGLLSGWLLDTYKRITVLAAAYIMYSTLCFILVLASLLGCNFQFLVIAFSLFSGMVVVIHENVYMTLPKEFEKSHDLAQMNSRILLVDFLAGSLCGASLSSFFSQAQAHAIEYALFTIALGVLCASFNCALLKKPAIENAYCSAKSTLLQGFTHIIKHPILMHISILALLLSFIFGMYQAFLISFVTGKDFLNLPTPYFGYVYAMYGAGVVIGSLVASKFYARFGLFPCIVLDVIATAGLMIVPCFIKNPYFVFSYIALAGAAVSFWYVSTSTIRQWMTPNALLGKVNGAYRILAYFGMPIGAFCSSYFLDFASIKTISVLFGIGLLALSLPSTLRLRQHQAGAVCK